MAREPLRFTVSRRAASSIYQESKRKGKREDFSLHEGVTIIEYAKKKRKPVKSLSPPLLKKKKKNTESTFIRSLVDDPDNLPVMVARPPGQSDVIKARKFHGHRLPSATNRTRDVSFLRSVIPGVLA